MAQDLLSALLAQPPASPPGLHPAALSLDIYVKIIGVFKPKSEEPYGQLNPKWTKYVHKTDKGFDKAAFESQMSVMRGQIHLHKHFHTSFFCQEILNLTQALRDGKSPVQLVQMPCVIVECSKSGGQGRSISQIMWKTAVEKQQREGYMSRSDWQHQ
ncbi:hypothetical protein A6R68_13426, partial [Neotoma lepida]